MSTSIRNGLRSGTIFGITLIFLALIDFTSTGAALVGKLFGNAPSFGLPPVFDLVVFMALMAVFAGTSAARPDMDHDRRSDAIIAGLAAGASCGVMLFVYSLIIGALYSNHIDPRYYLNDVSPDSMHYFLFKLDTLPGALVQLVIQVIFGALGGLLTHTLRNSNWQQAIQKRTEGIRASLQAPLARYRRLPYAIYITYALIGVLLFLIPQVWGSYWNYITGTVAIYIIMGLGLNIIVGLAGQLVLGYVAFFAMGAYGMALATAPQPLGIQWGFWPGLIVGIVAATLTGILLGLPILRLRGDYLAIVTLGFGEIIRNMLRSDLLTSFTGGPRGVRDIPLPNIFGLSLGSDTNVLYLIMVAMLLTIFITYRLQNSRAGRAWVAIREDEVAARATGINTFRSKLLALAIGAAFAGLAGALFASRNQFTGPDDHVLMVSINVLALVIVGGMGSIPGVILGSFALKGLPEILRELENFRMLFFSALLVVMMILRPEGLWPTGRPRLEKPEQKEETAPEREPSVEVKDVQHTSES